MYKGSKKQLKNEIVEKIIEAEDKAEKVILNAQNLSKVKLDKAREDMDKAMEKARVKGIKTYKKLIEDYTKKIKSEVSTKEIDKECQKLRRKAMKNYTKAVDILVSGVME